MAANRDVALNIIADVRKYQSEFAKIPGTTDKQAAKAAAALERRLSKAQKEAAKAAKKAAADSSKSWATVGDLISANLATEGLKMAAQAVAGWRGEVAASVDEINTLAKQTGLANETVAGLRFVADATGKQLSELVPPDRAKRIVETAQGTGEAKKGFDGLKVSVLDAGGQLKSSDAVLRETIDALKGIEDPTRRAALATQALGGQGALMLSSLADSAALDAFTEQARVLGVDVGPAAVRATNDWQLATAELGLAMDGFKASAVRALDIESNLRNFTTGIVFAKELLTGLSQEARDKFDQELALKIRQVKAEDIFDEQGVIDIVKSTEQAQKVFELSTLRVQAAAADAFEFAAIKASTATVEFLKNRRAINEAGEAAAAAASDVNAMAQAQAQAAKEAAAAAKEQAGLLDQRAKALGRLSGIQRSAAASALSDAQKVIRAGEQRLDQIDEEQRGLDELEAKGVDVSEARAVAELAALEVVADGQRKLDSIRDKAHEEELERLELEAQRRREIDDETAALAEQNRAEQLEAFEQSFEILGQFAAVALGGLAEVQRRQAQAAQAALTAARDAVNEIKDERAELVDRILDEEDQITRAKLEAELKRLEAGLRNAKTLRRQRRQDAQAAFRGEQAAALASVGFNTAASVLKAYAMFGPPPSPAGIASSIAAAAAGAAQAAIVATQQAPQYHTGADYVASFTRAGEVRASLTPGEAVLNARAADNLGRDTIQAANDTGAAPGSPVFVLDFERRHVDTMVSKTLQGGGSMRTSINKIARSRPAGQVSIMGA